MRISDLSSDVCSSDLKRQDSTTGLLIFDVPTIIETLSAGITLLPGDVIATGTPAGVGIGFKPPRYLGHGDVVRCEIGGIGVLENRLVDRARQAQARSEEHTSELQSLMRISYAVFCLKKKKQKV